MAIRRKTVAERIVAARTAAAAPGVPVSYISNADAGSLATPTPFDGEWAHSTNVYDEIVAAYRDDPLLTEIVDAALRVRRLLCGDDP